MHCAYDRVFQLLVGCSSYSKIILSILKIYCLILIFSFKILISLSMVVLPVTKTMSVEFARRKDPIICLLLHPGTVDTDLSKPFQRNVPKGNLFTKEFSVQKLLNIINNARSSDNGKFFAWDGQEIPW